MTVADISVVLHCIDLCTFRWFDGGGDVAAGSISYSIHRLAASVGGGVAPGVVCLAVSGRVC